MGKSLFILPLFLTLVSSAQLKITHLQAEHLVNPLGIDEKNPRLSWQITGFEKGIQK